MRQENKGGFVNECLDWLQVIYFFPLCWVIGGLLTAGIFILFGADKSTAVWAYFATGIGGTIWFARS